MANFTMIFTDNQESELLKSRSYCTTAYSEKPKNLSTQ